MNHQGHQRQDQFIHTEQGQYNGEEEKVIVEIKPAPPVVTSYYQNPNAFEKSHNTFLVCVKFTNGYCREYISSLSNPLLGKTKTVFLSRRHDKTFDAFFFRTRARETMSLASHEAH